MPAENETTSKPEREIRGDVGAIGGAIVHDGAVTIAGHISDGATIDITGNLKVAGSIGASTVKAGGDIHVAGNIVGRTRGNCVAGGRVSFRIANGGIIEAGAGVSAEVEVAGATIITFGPFECLAGNVHGGRITAAGGITCANLGRPAGSATLVEVGIDERLRTVGKTRARQIIQNREKIRKVRIEVARLLHQGKGLTAVQKEKCTELLFEADTSEQETNALARNVQRLVTTIEANCKTEVTVTGTINPGVTLRFADGETAVTKAITGPVKIWCKPLGNSIQIVITDLKCNTTEPMVTTAYADPDLLALRTALTPPTPRPQQQAHAA